MRVLRNIKFPEMKVKVVRFFMVKPIMWEYFVTDKKYKDKDIIQALVSGYEVELGDVYLPDVKSHMIVPTEDLEQVMPAPGWEWEIW